AEKLADVQSTVASTVADAKESLSASAKEAKEKAQPFIDKAKGAAANALGSLADVAEKLAEKLK
ncbi:hypothetical protein, partial [uncultured Duncaniella sp.]